jgi:heme exporter protein CcmD
MNDPSASLHAVYLWAAYGSAAVVLALEIWLTAQRHRHALQQAAQRHEA